MVIPNEGKRRGFWSLLALWLKKMVDFPGGVGGTQRGFKAIEGFFHGIGLSVMRTIETRRPS
jgi:hypothetical protein